MEVQEQSTQEQEEQGYRGGQQEPTTVQAGTASTSLTKRFEIFALGWCYASGCTLSAEGIQKHGVRAALKDKTSVAITFLGKFEWGQIAEAYVQAFWPNAWAEQE